MSGSKFRQIFKKVAVLLAISLIYSGIGYLAVWFLSYRFDYKMQDALACAGLILLFLGILMSMKGNPSGININGMGRGDANVTAYLNNEITRQEREMNPYYKHFFRNNIVSFAFSSLTFILGGAFLILSSVIFY